MFAGDPGQLGWADPKAETFGERKARKAQQSAERNASISTSHSRRAPSISSNNSDGSRSVKKSFFSSLSKKPSRNQLDDKSLSSRKQFAPVSYSNLPVVPPNPFGSGPDLPSRMQSTRSVVNPPRRAPSTTPSIDSTITNVTKTSYNTASTLAKTEPTFIDPNAAMYENQVVFANMGCKVNVFGKAPRETIREIHEIQLIDETSSVERVTTTTVETVDLHPPHVPPRSKYRSLKPDGGLSFDRLQRTTSHPWDPIPEETPRIASPSLHGFELQFEELDLRGPTGGFNGSRFLEPDAVDAARIITSSPTPQNSLSQIVKPTPTVKPARTQTPGSKGDHNAWQAPAAWGSKLSASEFRDTSSPPAAPHRQKDSVMETIESADIAELTHYQRFIRRMPSAGAKIMLDRIREEWASHMESITAEELEREKHLWLLAALMAQKNKNTFQRSLVPIPTLSGSRGGQTQILELFGNDAEVYQLSSHHPLSKIHHLTTSTPATLLDLPPNISYITLPFASHSALPYASSHFHVVRASSLPSLLQSPHIPKLLAECHRVLQPGGVLDLRVVDSTPVRKSMGPKLRSWFEDRLESNLERSFRCSKPSLVVPDWMEGVGFRILGEGDDGYTQTLRTSCAGPENVVVADEDAVEIELAAVVGRGIWKEVWGSLVVADEGSGGSSSSSRWWWEDAEIMDECRKCNTYFEIATVVGVKK